MNIIFPVIDDNSNKFSIAKWFHNSENTCIYIGLNNSYKWLNIKDITSCAENLSLALKRNGIYVIITSHMPFLALKLFKESGLLVYKSQGKNVKENIALYLDNKLELFTPQLQFNAIKGSACGSCTMSSCGPECN